MSGKHSVERNKRNERVQTSREPKKKRRGLKIFGTIVLILVVLIVAILSATYLYINDKKRLEDIFEIISKKAL